MSNEATKIIRHCDKSAAKQENYCLQNLSHDSVWVGEEVIKAAASYLSQAIHVYSEVDITWLLIYQPEGETAETSPSPITLAFYKLGHYMAAVCTQDNQHNLVSVNINNIEHHKPATTRPENLIAPVQQ